MGPENSVIVAPGEGKILKNVLYDDDWDIKAFPHINSPDGKYGLHFERETRLSDQYYFIQRICNQNRKFARSPAYVYAAVAHTELKQIQRNIFRLRPACLRLTNLVQFSQCVIFKREGNKQY